MTERKAVHAMDPAVTGLSLQEIAKKFAEARFVVVGKDNTLDRSFRRELKRMWLTGR